MIPGGYLHLYLFWKYFGSFLQVPLFGFGTNSSGWRISKAFRICAWFMFSLILSRKKYRYLKFVWNNSRKVPSENMAHSVIDPCRPPLDYVQKLWIRQGKLWQKSGLYKYTCSFKWQGEHLFLWHVVEKATHPSAAFQLPPGSHPLPISRWSVDLSKLWRLLRWLSHNG